MSIQTELTRITNAKAAIKAAIEGKGVDVPSGAKLDGLAALIEAIQAGGVQIGNFSTVKYGSFQLAEDASEYTIDLGYKGAGGAPAVEQFIILRDMQSTFSGTSTINSLVCFVYMTNITAASMSSMSTGSGKYYNSSGRITNTTGGVCEFNAISNDNTPRAMTVNASKANASCVLTAGATYNWIAMKRDE